MQFDTADDKKKELERAEGKLTASIADSKESIATLTDEVKTLGANIKALDKSVAEATENRKEENSDFKTLFANDAAAKELMEFAKNRLNKFYNPKLYKPPAKKELSKEDRIVANMGFLQGAPPPPPEAVPAYKKKGEESTGVIAMIDLLIADLDKEIQEIETNEAEAQR